jgi:hypothetical protein
MSALLSQSYTVLRAGPPEVMERLDRGEAPDPGSYYFRMSPMFETSARQYDWINRIVSVGVGHRLADGPIYSIFEISAFVRTNSAGITDHAPSGKTLVEANQELFIFKKGDDGQWRIARYSFSPINPPQI